MSKQLRVAFCGTRGLPANYGGFETAIDEISQRFVRDQMDCYVFCREHRVDQRMEAIHGRKLIYIKGSKSKRMDTFVSSIQTGLYLMKHKKSFDYILWFNNANVFGILLTLFTRIPMSINTDGLEWRRAKWSFPFKAFYFLSSFIISRTCKSLVSDSISIQQYYKKVFMKRTEFIPYGAPERISITDDEKRNVLEKYNLVEDKYFLQITRFEPDNLPLDILEAFQHSELYLRGYKHVLIGYQDDHEYSLKLMACNDEYGVMVLPANYDHKELSILRENAFGYVHGNSVGGTNPALLEAMQSCKRIFAIDGPFSSEVLGNEGVLFRTEFLSDILTKSLDMPDQSLRMQLRIRDRYQWDAVAHSYLNLIQQESANYMPREKPGHTIVM
ncbi:DUF1972 domain-containing protein [Paenibacillus sp. CMAA1364]